MLLLLIALAVHFSFVLLFVNCVMIFFGMFFSVCENKNESKVIVVFTITLFLLNLTLP
jgi:hypothetical protein